MSVFHTPRTQVGFSRDGWSLTQEHEFSENIKQVLGKCLSTKSCVKILTAKLVCSPIAYYTPKVVIKLKQACWLHTQKLSLLAVWPRLPLVTAVPEYTISMNCN